jgi:hypothetical protein
VRLTVIWRFLDFLDVQGQAKHEASQKEKTGETEGKELKRCTGLGRESGGARREGD